MIQDDESYASKHPFYLRNGKSITSLEELKNYLVKISPGDFIHHVNAQRNDFEAWIRHSLSNNTLADGIKTASTSQEIVSIIENFCTPKILPPDRPEKDEPWKTMKEEAQPALANEEDDSIPEVSYIKTGIPGFDELITNGIPHGSAVLLCGGPGTGKTTFCLHMICNAAKKAKKCIYLTFEEEVLNLKRHIKNFGFAKNMKELEENIRIIKMQPFDLSKSVEALLAKASGELTIELDEIEGIIPKDFRPDIVILDSLSAVAAAFTGKEEGYRIYIDQLFSLFKKVGATSFLITEIEQDASRYSKNGIEEFLADAVIVFYNLKTKNIRVNALEIIKIRGTLHQKKTVPFKIISSKGIIVYPMEEVFNERA